MAISVLIIFNLPESHIGLDLTKPNRSGKKDPARAEQYKRGARGLGQHAKGHANGYQSQSVEITEP